MRPRHAVPAALAAACIAAPAAMGSFGFDDIEYWVGAGANRAALVIDWNDGTEPQSLAWGFRWDGAATGEDMLLAIAEDDPRLFARVGVVGSFGLPLYGLGYDLDADGFSIDDGTAFTDGVAVTAPSDAALATDPDDHYREGWLSAGFWTYWLRDADPAGAGAWTDAQTGVSARPLADGAWDGLSFDPAFSFTDPPSVPVAAIPAPGGALALFALTGGAIVRRRRNDG